MRLFSTVISLLGLVFFFSTLVYGSAGIGALLLCAAVIIFFEYFFAFFKRGLFNPYTFMLLSPLLLIHYSSIADFRIRALCFLFLAYILTAAFTPAAKKIRFSLMEAKPIVTWFAAFAIFSLAALIVYMQGIHLSGDEPHYIMISQSIVEDGDFDLKNQMEEKRYFKYLPVEVRLHGGDYQGRYRSFHLPGVSFLLLPFYWLFHLLGGAIPARLFFRLAAAFINAFFALGLLQILKMKFPGKNITPFWLLFLVTFPLFFHGIHLYPELPAAALMMFGYLFAFRDRRNPLLCGLFLSLIPWFHVKYIPALAVLALVILYRLLKEKQGKPILYLFIFPIISFSLLLVYGKVLYGSFNPAAVFPREGYFAVPILARLRTLLAYFFDQRDGLLFYAPLFFLAFFGVKRKFAGRGILLAIAAVYILAHANTTVRGAYSPAGRPVMFVSWILIILIVNHYYGSKQANGHPTRLLAGFSFFTLAWLFYYPLFVYQPVTRFTAERASGLLTFFGSSWLDLSQFFPSFLSTRQNWTYPANIAWLTLLALAVIIFYLPRLKTPVLEFLKKGEKTIAALLFLILALLLCFYPHVHLLPQNKFVGKTVSFYNNSRNFRFLEERGIFRIKAGPDYDIFFDLKYAKQDQIHFHFLDSDRVDVTIRNGNRPLFQSGGKANGRFSFSLSTLKKLKVKNKLVAHLGIETRARAKDTFLFLKIASDNE